MSNPEEKLNWTGQQRLLHLLNPAPEIAPLFEQLQLSSFETCFKECIERRPEIFFVVYYLRETGFFSAEAYEPTSSGWLVQDMDDDLLRRRPPSITPIPVVVNQPFTGQSLPVAIWGITTAPTWNKDILGPFAPENVVLFWQLLPVFGATLSEYFNYAFSSSIIAKEETAMPEEFLHTLLDEKFGQQTSEGCLDALAELVLLARYLSRLETCG